MTIWALGDLHLAVSTPGKEMDYFGGTWQDYTNKIEAGWKAVIKPEDLVLLPGDISWALKLAVATIDLEWIDRLPGTKVMIKGNHDLWWGSLTQVRAALPPSLHVIQNDVFKWQNIEIAGARLWDSSEYSYGKFVEMKPNARAKEQHDDLVEDEKIFIRELSRLETSLRLYSTSGTRRFAMTHYPPIGHDLAPSRASQLLEKYKVETCIFGHIHQVLPGAIPLGTARGVTYHLTSSDYLNFQPLKIN